MIFKKNEAGLEKAMFNDSCLAMKFFFSYLSFRDVAKGMILDVSKNLKFNILKDYPKIGINAYLVHMDQYFQIKQVLYL